MRENAVGPAVLAAQCAAADIRLVTFSSDQVFDGQGRRPWVESDVPAPLNVYGRSKAVAERDVLAAWPRAMVVRTSAFFGPWDSHNFVTRRSPRWRKAKRSAPRAMCAISPTYVPDLVNACLDLLIDGEAGIWHLANEGDVSWAELAELAASARRVERGDLARRCRKSSRRAGATPRLRCPRERARDDHADPWRCPGAFLRRTFDGSRAVASSAAAIWRTMRGTLVADAVQHFPSKPTACPT